LDVRRTRTTPAGVEQLVRRTAEEDGRSVTVLLEQEPGSAGKALVDRYVTLLAGYTVRAEKPTGDKITLESNFSSQAEAGKVFVIERPWNGDFLDELEGFPLGSHDDQVDATAQGFGHLAPLSSNSMPEIVESPHNNPLWGVYLPRPGSLRRRL
jgi:predicted phage terminase large subunit-like protein